MDVEIFHHRLIDIDPYYQYVSKLRPDIYAIPEIAVSLEELQEPVPETIESLNWSDMMEKIWSEKTLVQTNAKDAEISWDTIFSRQDFDPSFTKNETADGNTDKKEPIPDWKKAEEEIKDDAEFTNRLEKMQNDLIAESGLVDHDAPIVEPPVTENEAASSIWSIDPESKPIQLEKMDEDLHDQGKAENTSKKDSEEQKTEQYYGVVLKDAHDALLSGFPDRSVEGYRQLLQENRMSQKATDQLRNDLINYPTNFQLWIILGDSYQRLGMASEALDAYQNAQKYLGSQERD